MCPLDSGISLHDRLYNLFFIILLILVTWRRLLFLRLVIGLGSCAGCRLRSFYILVFRPFKLAVGLLVHSDLPVLKHHEYTTHVQLAQIARILSSLAEPHCTEFAIASIVLQSILVIFEQIFSLLQDTFEKLLRADREVLLHMIDFNGIQNEHLTSLDRLHAKISAICGPKAILLKAKLMRFPLLIVEQGSHVYDDILSTEVLLTAHTILKSFCARACSEHHRINDGEHLILQVRHHKGTNTSDCQVKTVNWITFLVEVCRLRI